MAFDETRLEPEPASPEFEIIKVGLWILLVMANLAGAVAVAIYLIPWPSRHGPDFYTQSLIQDLEHSLNTYRTQHSALPPPVEAGLAGDGRFGELFAIDRSRLDAAGRILDHWKRPFVYRVHPGTLGRPKARFELYSKGPNGIDENGQGDDVTADSR
jgi:hypothetical protein